MPANLRRSPEPPPILRNNTREIYYLLREEEKERKAQAKIAKKTRAEKIRKTPESDTASDDASFPCKKPKLIPSADQGAGSGLAKTDCADDLKSEPDVTDTEKSTWFPVVEATGELVLYPSLFSWVSRQSPETFSMLKKFGFRKS